MGMTERMTDAISGLKHLQELEMVGFKCTKPEALPPLAICPALKSLTLDVALVKSHFEVLEHVKFPSLEDLKLLVSNLNPEDVGAFALVPWLSQLKSLDVGSMSMHMATNPWDLTGLSKGNFASLTHLELSTQHLRFPRNSIAVLPKAFTHLQSLELSCVYLNKLDCTALGNNTWKLRRLGLSLCHFIEGASLVKFLSKGNFKQVLEFVFNGRVGGAEMEEIKTECFGVMPELQAITTRVSYKKSVLHDALPYLRGDVSL